MNANGMVSNDSELSNERFGFTVFLSACVHGMVILGVGFTYLEESNSQPALEITMAQYRSELAPDDADFLAQENQVGSGVTEETLAPSTPFESDFNADRIEEVVPIPEMPEYDDRPVEDIAVVSALAEENAISQQLDEIEPQETPSEQMTPEQISLAIASLQAQLDLRREEYAKRPRRYTLTSASTRKSHDALYLDGWRRRIEAIGNLNYPEEARRQELYGTLRMLVSLRPDGEVDEVEILSSSGYHVLDQAAVQIVHLAAPFEPFPEAMRSEVDILEIIRTWRFHEGDALVSF